MAVSSKFLKLETLSPNFQNSILIYGSSVCGLTLAEKLKNSVHTVSIIDKQFNFEGSDHNYRILQNFIRKANIDAYDKDLSQYYGWNNTPDILDWNLILSNYQATLNHESSKITSLIEQFLTDRVPDHSYSFNTTVNKEVTSNFDQISNVFADKQKIEAFEIEKITPGSKSLLIYASAPEALEYALFLARYLQIQCVVIITNSISAKISKDILPLYFEYLKGNNVHCVNDESVIDGSIFSNAEISTIVKDSQLFIFYPNFVSKVEINPNSSDAVDYKKMMEFSKCCNLDFEQQIVFASKIAHSMTNNDYSQIPFNKKFNHIFQIQTPLEYCSVGMTEDNLSLLDQSNLNKYSFKGNILEHELSFGELPGTVFILTEDVKENKIISIQIYGPRARKILSGMMLMFEHNLSFNDLHLNIGIHPTIAENLFSNLNKGVQLETAGSC